MANKMRASGRLVPNEQLLEEGQRNQQTAVWRDTVELGNKRKIGEADKAER